MKARAGTLPLSPARTFTKLVLVGHSVGSLVSNPLTAKYPNDADAVVLTGFSKTLTATQILLFGLAPADIVDPTRYGGLNPGYLEVSSEPGFDTAFYWPGDYDTAFAHYDFLNRGTIPLGEGITILVSTTVATAYTKPVYVISGEHDEIFCYQLVGSPSCDATLLAPSILQTTNTLYPNVPASKYGWFSVPDAGHDWQFHLNNGVGLAAVHGFLATQGF